MNELININPKDVKSFIFDGMTVDAKVYKIYDGDTIRCIFKFHDIYVKYSCRLMGLDTPEMKGGSESEHNFAVHIRDWLRELILNKIVKLELLSSDKYGRLLVNVFYEGKNINKLIIEKGYAKEYDGGSKSTLWTEEEFENFNNKLN